MPASRTPTLPFRSVIDALLFVVVLAVGTSCHGLRVSPPSAERSDRTHLRFAGDEMQRPWAGLEDPASGPLPPRYEPPADPVPGPRVDLRAITVATTRDDACAIEAETGVVWCWGFAMLPAIGPVALRGIRDAVAVTVSELQGCAATRAGAIWCWGYDAHGDAGLEAIEGAGPAPTRLRIDDAIDVGIGEATGCAVRRNGHVACWPMPSGTPDRWRNVSTPVDVPGVEGVAEVAVGGSTTCARRTDGRVTCWGDSIGAPRDVGSPPVRDLSAGGETICGVSTQGDVWCIDDDDVEVRSIPGMRGVRQVTSSGRSVCGARDDGSVACHAFGASGDSSAAIEAMHDVAYAARGVDSTCAVLRDARVACVGDDRMGAIGNPLGDRRFTPAIVDGIDDVVQLEGANDSAGMTTCARLRNGEVLCWGRRPGMCGRSDRGPCLRPRSMPIPHAIDVAVGVTMACAVHADGTVTCWAEDDEGVDAPVVVHGIHDAIDVAAESDACAVLSDGSVLCFSSYERGHVPRAVEGLPAMRSVRTVGTSGFAGVARDGTEWTWHTNLINGYVGAVQPMPTFAASQWDWAHACAIDGGGQMRCSRGGPSTVRVVAEHAQAFCLTTELGCVALEDGAVECWNETRGDIGGPDDELTLRRAPTTERATSLTCGDGFACALLVDGHVACWGDRGEGYLGDGTVSDYTTPFIVTRPAP